MRTTTRMSAATNAASDDGSGPDHTEDDRQRQCSHHTLLGIFLETLALSHASSLSLTALTRTAPALASYPRAAVALTLAWAVRVRILDYVFSSGEALPPDVFLRPRCRPGL